MVTSVAADELRISSASLALQPNQLTVALPPMTIAFMVHPTKQHGIGRRSLIIGSGSLLAAPAIVRAQGTNGVALVIGNSKYRWEASLPNVKRDTPDVSKRFQSLGLKTELIQDANKETMRKAINNFRSAPAGTNFGVCYFAGHGVNFNNNNYMVPVDADLANPNVDALVPIGWVHGALRKIPHRLAVFDACRNNPADGWRQQQTQDKSIVRADVVRANAEKEAGRLTIFSTAPGRTALDGPAGQNSPFAAAFLRQLAGGGIDIQALGANLRRELLLATQGRQLVYDFNFYDRPFSLTGPRDAGAGSSPGGGQAIELPKAYAYAKENGFDLPQGLIALRGAREAQKIGTFKFAERNNRGIEPLLLIVMAIDESKTAQMILSGRNERGPWWRFVTGTVSGDRLDYNPHSTSSRFIFDWRGANAGSVGIICDRCTNARPFSTDFTRLDG